MFVSAKRAVAVLSPFLTLEEAFALGSAFKKGNKDIRLVLGPVPVEGEDDHYPKNAKGEHVPPAKFHHPRREVPRTAWAWRRC